MAIIYLLPGLVALPLAAVYFGQRALVFPAPRVASDARGPAQELTVEGPDGPIRALWMRASEGRRTLVFLHGNGAQLNDAQGLASLFQSAGVGLIALEYPGYAGAPGAPSEASIMACTDAVLREVLRQAAIPHDAVVLVGQSLGTGVAVGLAARGYGARMILLSPFTSIPDVAERIVPFLARVLVRDRFDSASRAPALTLPTLVLHGTDDEVVPFALGERLARGFPNGELRSIRGAHHNDLWERRDVVDAVLGFAQAP